MLQSCKGSFVCKREMCDHIYISVSVLNNTQFRATHYEHVWNRTSGGNEGALVLSDKTVQTKRLGTTKLQYIPFQ